MIKVAISAKNQENTAKSIVNKKNQNKQWRDFISRYGGFIFGSKI